ncbi:MAG: TraB/GumN family protein [Pseudomonadota bacterium]
MRALIVCLLCLPGLVHAACSGRDMREHLTPEQDSAFAAQMAGTPYPEGNHWIARRGGDTLHLVGTIHIHDPRLDPIAARLAPIIRSADRLLAEAEPDGEAKLQAHLAQNPSLIRIPAPSLIDRLDADTWAALADAARARGIPPAMAAQLQPWYLSLSLAVPPCVTVDLVQGKRGLDHRLMDIALAEGVPIQALEPYTTIFELFAAQPLDEQIAAIELGILPAAQATDAMVTVIEQYFDEAHASTFPLNAILAKGWLDMDPAAFDAMFAEMLDKLLYTRNDNWMPRLLEARGTSVVAVGAAHLGGTGGLLEMLEAEGFTLERAAF